MCTMRAISHFHSLRSAKPAVPLQRPSAALHLHPAALLVRPAAVPPPSRAAVLLRASSSGTPGVPGPSGSGPAPSSAAAAAANPAESSQGSRDSWDLGKVLSTGFGVAAVAWLLWKLCSLVLSWHMAGPTVAVAPVSLGDWLGERMLYFVGKVSSLNVAAKVVLVLTSTAPAIVVFGALYSAITQAPMKAALLKMYALLNRLPGAAVLNETTLAAAVLVNAVFFIGMFVFAVMLGVVTDEIKTTFKDIRNGKYPVNQAGHMVVLNWNPQAIPLLQHLAAARKSGQVKMCSSVAVLADVPKADMDKAIASKLKGAGLEVYTRSGNPTVPADLATVAAAQAASIIVLDPQQGKAANGSSLVTQLGVGPAHTAVSLAAASPNLHNQKIIFQAPAENGRAVDQVEAFKRLTQLGSDVQMMRFSKSSLITRVVTVSAIQPGMQQVMMQLLRPAGVSFRELPVPQELVGTTYRHARRQYADGVMCGVMHAGGVVDLLVPEDHVLLPNDVLVMLSPLENVPLNPQAEQVFAAADADVKARLRKGRSHKSKPRNIIVLTLVPEQVPDLVEVFAEMAPRGSQATFVLPAASTVKEVSRMGNCTFKYLKPDLPSSGATISSVLKDAGIDTATAVVITGVEKALSPADADAFVTAAVLQIQDAVLQVGRQDAPHVVAQVCSPSTSKSINTYLDVLRKEAAKSGRSPARILHHPDLFFSDSMAATILAHTTVAPHFYTQLIQELLDNERAELYFRSPEAFNLECGDLYMFADVAETVRRFGETALGVIYADGKTVLAPEPTHPINFQDGDKIIVFAEEYDTSKAKSS